MTIKQRLFISILLVLIITKYLLIFEYFDLYNLLKQIIEISIANDSYLQSTEAIPSLAEKIYSHNDNSFKKTFF